MKKVSLNFREVAVDGLPENSMNVLAALCTVDGLIYHVAKVPYSAKHKQFNALDYSSKNEIDCFSDVRFWVPASEFCDEFGGETP